LKNVFIRGNSKLGKDVLIFNLPPGGKKQGGVCRPTAWCKENCYAMKGLHVLPQVKKANTLRLSLALTDEFVGKAIGELKRSSKPYVRIHASGEFFSADYIEKWIQICRAVPEKKFLAFTKSIHLKEELQKLARLPNVSLYESLDSSRPHPSTTFLLASVDDGTILEKNAIETERLTLTCPGECGPCKYKCWDRDKNVVFKKH